MGLNSRFVMMNTKYKMNVYGTINWFDSEELTVFKATRMSNRGVIELIYVIGAGVGYGVNIGDRIPYITDTGKGYGGKGELVINDIIVSGKKYGNNLIRPEGRSNINEVVKLPVWVLK